MGSRRSTQQRNTGRWLTSYSHFAGYNKAAQAVRDPAGTRDGLDDPVPYAGKEGRLDLPRGGMPSSKLGFGALLPLPALLDRDVVLNIKHG